MEPEEWSSVRLHWIWCCRPGSPPGRRAGKGQKGRCSPPLLPRHRDQYCSTTQVWMGTRSWGCCARTSRRRPHRTLHRSLRLPCQPLLPADIRQGHTRLLHCHPDSPGRRRHCSGTLRGAWDRGGSWGDPHSLQWRRFRRPSRRRRTHLRCSWPLRHSRRRYSRHHCHRRSAPPPRPPSEAAGPNLAPGGTPSGVLPPQMGPCPPQGTREDMDPIDCRSH
mmetsp:Transcript_37614/g.90696  ORF Transcript_37614/g.90696 Transcript_37614/m.90696 type:complete len:220 (-) Transcript_37614:58-717(-)